MSLKDLFSNKEASNSKTQLKSLADLNVDRGRKQLLEQLKTKNNLYTPTVNFSNPRNFAKYGSAKDYYTYSIQRVYQDYPYDGTLQEKLEWENNSTFLDTYIFDNVYPRTNGFVLFSPGNEGWGSQNGVSDSTYKIGLPATLEYIAIKGGPNNDADHKVTSAKSKANVYDVSTYRESNLKFDLENSGSTVEFWLKVDDFLAAGSTTTGSIIFDLWNGATSSHQDYGRFTITFNNYHTGTMSGSGFMINCVSGTGGDQKGFSLGAPSAMYPAIFPEVTSGSVADATWHHYAFVLQNTGTAGGMGGGDIKATMYRDGTFVSSITRSSHGIGEIKGLTNGLHATIGAGIAWPGYASDPGTIISRDGPNGQGCGKLSGSIDEFRYWKTTRTEKQIKDNWFVPVVGGTNNESLDRNYDTTNVDLGVYYKFNEGKTLTASTDQTILDYSGRVCNGTWKGTYVDNNRQTGSAFVLSGKASKEFKDPIVYSFHPDVVSLKERLEMSGTIHDNSNSSMLFNRFPTWIREGDESESVLKNLTQILSSYLDTLHLQIEQLPTVVTPNYVSASQQPSEFPYYGTLSKGLLLPSVFIDETISNKILNKTEDLKFEKDINNIKRLIYSNIENNLENILKSKGTKAAFRNLLRCYGVDSNLVNVNIYADNVVQTIKDTGEYISEKKNFINFASGNNDAVVVNYVPASSASANWINAHSAISGTRTEWVYGGMSRTYEAQAMFPRIYSSLDREGTLDRQASEIAVSSSVFGAVPCADENAGGVLAWAGSPGRGKWRVIAARENQNSKRAKFILTGTGFFGVNSMTSSYYDDVFDNSVWNFAVRYKPEKDQSGFISGSRPGPTSGGTFSSYEINFYGVQTRHNEIVNEFELTASEPVTGVPRPTIQEIGNFDYSMFAGAYRTNFTGAVIESCEANVSSVRAWEMYRSSEDIKRSATDKRNYGVTAPEQSAYLFQTVETTNDDPAFREQVDKFIPKMKTLILNWDFEGITGSNDAGEFVVYDVSSGSAPLTRDAFTALTPVSGTLARQYPGFGYGFKASSTDVITTEYLDSFRRDPLETYSTEDAVNILNDDDRAFNTEYRPVNFVLSIEKSPYEIISREMLNVFGNISQVGNLFGRYVDKFRHKYKSLEYVRSLFFQNVKNTPDVEKFLDYYIWVDETLNTVLRQLIPISADHIDGHDVIESHVLERNKYHYPYPTIDLQAKDIEVPLFAINELLYSWESGHAPVQGFNERSAPPAEGNRYNAQTSSCLWWNERALTGEKGALRSALSPVGKGDADKAELRKVITTHVSGNTYALRNFSKVYNLSSHQDNVIVGGHNPPNRIGGANRPNLLRDGLAPQWTNGRNMIKIANTTNAGAGFTEEGNKKTSFAIINIRDDEGLNKVWGGHRPQFEQFEYPVLSQQHCEENKAARLRGKAPLQLWITATLGYTAGPSTLLNGIANVSGNFGANNMAAPFSFYSSSYNLNNQWSDGNNIMGTDPTGLHKDTVNDDLSIPMQSPFTNEHVGGLSYRHAFLNTAKSEDGGSGYIDGAMGGLYWLQDRPEGWFLAPAGTVSTKWAYWSTKGMVASGGHIMPCSNVAGRWYRNVRTKRPVNIQNIQTITQSAAYYISSGDNIAPLRPIMGNYSEAYEVVSTTGRDVQRPFFRKGIRSENLGSPSASLDGGMPLYSSNTAVSEVPWFIRADVYGANTVRDMFNQSSITDRLKYNKSTLGSISTAQIYRGANRTLLDRENVFTAALDNIHDPVFPEAGAQKRIKNKTVFADKFSAPGGYEVMSRGFLDPESETYSVYNAMPWRNRTVRKELDNKYRTFSAQFGFQGRTLLTGNIGVPIAGIQPSGGFWTASSDLDTAMTAPMASASLHKVNRNPAYRIKWADENYVSSNIITASVFDNWFVQHQIPQSDRQYSWITASLVDHRFGVSAPLGFANPRGYVNSVVNGPTSSIQFMTSSEVVSFVTPTTAVGRIFGAPEHMIGTSLTAIGAIRQVIYTDIAGMNTNIYEPLTGSDNTLGFPELVATNLAGDAGGELYQINYLNSGLLSGFNPPSDLDNAFMANIYDPTVGGAWDNLRGEVAVLNAIVLHRQGPYGWPSWKQVRGAQHPVARAHRTYNTMSVNYTRDANSTVDSSLLYNVIEPPASVKYRETTLTTKHKSNKRYGTLIPFSSIYSHFDDNKLNNYLSVIPNTNNSNLDRVVEVYEDLADTPDDIRMLTLEKINYSEVIYPRGENTFLGRTRGRQNNIIDYWNEKRADRTVSTSTTSQNVTAQNKSKWVLDAREGMEDATFSANTGYLKIATSVPTGGYGELQNPGVIYHMGFPAHVTASALYSRPVPEAYKQNVLFGTPAATQGHGIVFGGDTMWETGKQAGKPSDGPFYETYDDYAEDLRAAGKEYSIIPEFRMSENMDYYITEKNGNFLADFSNGDPVKLSATGSAIENSLTDTFYRKYATSDFLKFFEKTTEKVSSIAERDSISLTCKALMKFLPYNGFYPAQRTTEIASLFSQSYGDFLEVSGTQGNLRTLLQPMFAPGLLHNTIKSGIAVDYPVLTDGYLMNALTGSPGNGSGDNGIPRLDGASLDYRLPFETLVEPENYLNGRTIYDMEPGFSASLSSSVIFKGGGDPRYSLAMHNFLAESANFFLHENKITTFSSQPDNKGAQGESTLFNVEPLGEAAQGISGVTETTPKHYRMRVSLSHAKYRNPEAIVGATAAELLTFLSEKSYVWNPSTIQMYSRQSGSVSHYQEGHAINYFYGSSFGPPCKNSTTAGTVAIALKHTASYAPFTPPYYNGLAYVDLEFRPTRLGYHNVDDILEKTIIVKDVRYTDTLLPTTDTAVNHKMRLTASISLAQTTEVPLIEFDKDGNAISVSQQDAAKRWVIQPKYETPILDFANADATLPAVGSGSVARGMWHQYGSIPTGDAGLFMQISQPPTKDGTNNINYTLTGSLADLVGFSKQPVKLGRLGERKVVREAIIAIPYKPDVNGNMEFYKLDARQVGDAKLLPNDAIPTNSVEDMVQKLKRYVLPPRFDFINNTVEAIQPFAMYVFEFEHTFTQDDLKDMWQNVPPSTLLDITEPRKTTATVSHPLLAGELLKDDVDSEVQWLVFKVKQRAKTNYFELTADSKDDERFKFNIEGGIQLGQDLKYSYNWPYDFFTMVELAQIEAGVEYKSNLIDETQPVVTQGAGGTNVIIQNVTSPPVSSDVRREERRAEREASTPTTQVEQRRTERETAPSLTPETDRRTGFSTTQTRIQNEGPR